MRYGVHTWNDRSEAAYHFGPFATEAEAIAFVDKLPDQYSTADVYCLNAPALMGTGQEMSMV